MSFITVGGVLAVAVFLAAAALAAPLSTLIHELGHALAGRLAGLKPESVSVGAGAPLARLRLGGLTLSFGRDPFGGGTAGFRPGPPPARRAAALMLLGGPAANLGLAAALGLALPHAHGAGLAALFGLIVSQLAFAADALAPRAARVGDAVLPSDGQALLALLRPTK